MPMVKGAPIYGTYGGRYEETGDGEQTWVPDGPGQWVQDDNDVNWVGDTYITGYEPDVFVPDTTSDLGTLGGVNSTPSDLGTLGGVNSTPTGTDPAPTTGTDPAPTTDLGTLTNINPSGYVAPQSNIQNVYGTANMPEHSFFSYGV
jgi:hypothetical protein